MKYIFVKALRGLLPDRVLDRPKQGFAPPIGSWLRKHLDALLRDTILSDTCRRRRILNAAEIDALVRRHKQGRPCDYQLWTLISFELWCRTFLDGRVRAARPAPGPFVARTGGRRTVRTSPGPSPAAVPRAAS